MAHSVYDFHLALLTVSGFVSEIIASYCLEIANTPA